MIIGVLLPLIKGDQCATVDCGRLGLAQGNTDGFTIESSDYSEPCQYGQCQFH